MKIDIHIPKMKTILKQFCCGFSLRTGTLIFAIISLILVLLPIASVVYDEEAEIHIHTGIVLGVIYVFFSALICVAAIIGVLMRKYEFFAPFIIFSVISLIVSVISFILTVFAGMPIVPQDTILFFMKKIGTINTHPNGSPYFTSNGFYALFLIIWVVVIGIMIYFVLTAYSYYCQLLLESRGKKTDSESGRSSSSSTTSTTAAPSKATAITKTAASKKNVSQVSPKKSFAAYSRAFYSHSKSRSQQDDRSNSEIVILE